MRLRLALQNKGRIGHIMPSFLAKAGLDFSIMDRQLLARCENFPLDLLFVRHGDIPTLLEDQAADLGVVGTDLLNEYEYQVKELLPLGLSPSRLCLAVPEDSTVLKAEDLKGLRVATNFSNITKKFFQQKNIDVTIIPLSGSVEVAPTLGVAEAIADLVGTGTTLSTNRLRVVEEIMFAQACLIGTPELAEEKQELLDELLFRFQSVIQARDKKSLYFNLPRKQLGALRELQLGLSGPTISQIESPENLVAVMVVVKEKELWSTMRSLQSIGATGLLVMNIERVVN